MKILIGLLTVAAAVAAVTTENASTASSSLEIIQSIDLPKEVSGVKLRELSALAYDPANGMIWAISDKAELHSFKVGFKKNSPSGVSYVGSTPLDTPLRNAEGMTFLPALRPSEPGRLLVAFEEGPALISFTTQGKDPVQFNLPAPLDNPAAYAEENSRLESVTIDSSGRFLTAPEEALQGRPDTEHTIFASDGGIYKFPTFQPHRSNIKALEFLEQQGKILVMERTRDDAGVSTMRLRLVDVGACANRANCDVVELTADEPEKLVGNFEGLTRLSGNYFAAVTDVKHKEAVSTKLVIFRIENVPSR